MTSVQASARSRCGNDARRRLTAPKYCRAILSVITATLGVPSRSRASKTRPCSSGMRSVSKKPGPAQIIDGGARRSRVAGRALDDDRRARGLHRQAVQQRRGLHARNGGDPPQELVVDVPGRGRRVAGEAHVGLEHGHAVHGIADAQRSRLPPACCRKMLVTPSSSTEIATCTTISAFFSVSRR